MCSGTRCTTDFIRGHRLWREHDLWSAVKTLCLGARYKEEGGARDGPRPLISYATRPIQHPSQLSPAAASEYSFWQFFQGATSQIGTPPAFFTPHKSICASEKVSWPGRWSKKIPSQIQFGLSSILISLYMPAQAAARTGSTKGPSGAGVLDRQRLYDGLPPQPW